MVDTLPFSVNAQTHLAYDKILWWVVCRCWPTSSVQNLLQFPRFNSLNGFNGEIWTHTALGRLIPTITGNQGSTSEQE